nr:Smr/MutS family protein [uncultured Neokomagataea sp.]
MAKRRNVREEEATLWRLVMRDVVPLHSDASSTEQCEEKDGAALPQEPEKAAPPVQKKRVKTKAMRRVVMAPAPTSVPVQAVTPEQAAYRVDVPEPSFADMMARSIRRLPKVGALKVGVRAPGLDNTSWKRLTRGTLRVEAKLDLHGYIVQDAFERLLDFLQRARTQNLKCIEVVTGLGSGEQSGAIRRELPLWLQRADIRGMILAVVHTHKANHGAVRILLKTRR